ncbi:MAG: DUF2279 domain-containing protein [Kofleriaceae bacterium]
MRALALLLGLAATVTPVPAAADCPAPALTAAPTAEPTTAPPSADPATAPAATPDCPPRWVHLGASVPAPEAPPPPDRRLRAALAVGGIYAAFSAWAYLAWYRDVPSLASFGYGGDGFFGRNTYAGGADKLGHAWANLVLGRATAGVLRWGGFGRTTSAITGSALAWGLFLAVEVKDGFYYKFSGGDALMNTAGATLSALLVMYPRLDELIDFRVAYWPSAEYLGLWRGEYYGSRKGNSLNIAEDYSGETYFLALHLGALPRPAATPRWAATALDYLDLGVGFESRKYKPDAPPEAVPRQHLFLGATVNLQRVLDRTLGRSRRRGLRTTARVGHAVLEHLAPPFSIVPVLGASRDASGPAPEQ